MANYSKRQKNEVTSPRFELGAQIQRIQRVTTVPRSQPQTMPGKDTICVRTTTCESRLPGYHNPYSPKHTSDKPTQEPSPCVDTMGILQLPRSSRDVHRGPPTFTLNHWALSLALCRRYGHLQSIQNDTKLSKTCHESPLKCHLRQPCSSPKRFSSGLRLSNRFFSTSPGETPY